MIIFCQKVPSGWLPDCFRIFPIFDRILADQARIKYTEIELAKNGKKSASNPLGTFQQKIIIFFGVKSHFFGKRCYTFEKTNQSRYTFEKTIKKVSTRLLVFYCEKVTCLKLVSLYLRVNCVFSKLFHRLFRQFSKCF